MSTERRAALTRTVGTLLLAVGVGLLGWLALPDVLYVTGRVSTAPPYRTHSDPSTSGKPLPKGRRVVIPAAGIDALIVEGRTERALSRGVWHEPQSGDPGEGTHVVLAGHRMRRYFSLLHRVKPNDRVLVYWDGVEHSYRVSSTKVVSAANRSVAKPGGPERLTLYTCLPRWMGNRRRVVTAVPEL